jgi:hypothetical protein
MDGDISTIRQLQSNMSKKERRNHNQKRWISNNYDNFREYHANYQKNYMRRIRTFQKGWNELTKICVEDWNNIVELSTN